MVALQGTIASAPGAKLKLKRWSAQASSSVAPPSRSFHSADRSAFPGPQQMHFNSAARLEQINIAMGKETAFRSVLLPSRAAASPPTSGSAPSQPPIAPSSAAAGAAPRVAPPRAPGPIPAQLKRIVLVVATTKGEFDTSTCGGIFQGILPLEGTAAEDSSRFRACSRIYAHLPVRGYSEGADSLRKWTVDHYRAGVQLCASDPWGGERGVTAPGGVAMTYASIASTPLQSPHPLPTPPHPLPTPTPHAPPSAPTHPLLLPPRMCCAAGLTPAREATSPRPRPCCKHRSPRPFTRRRTS